MVDLEFQSHVLGMITFLKKLLLLEFFQQNIQNISPHWILQGFKLEIAKKSLVK